MSFSITVPTPPSLPPSLCPRWRVCGCRRLLKHGRGRLIIDGVFSSVQAGQRAAPAHSHASGPADSLSGASEYAHTCTQARIQRQTETHAHTHTNCSPNLCVAIHMCAYLVYPTRDCEAQSAAARQPNKSSKDKSNLFDQNKRRKTCLHWLQACTIHTSPQLSTSFCCTQ